MTAPLTQGQKVIHFLNRISFGAKPEEIERVNRLGFSSYLEEQLYPEKIPDSLVEEKLAELKTIRLSSRELLELYPQQNQANQQGQMSPSRMQGPRYVILELQRARLLRAVYSQRQLYEVMIDFWTNHFNVFAGKGADRWLVTSYDRDTIRPHAMGRFHELLLATAKSPAMLFYLDNWLSVSPDAPAIRLRPNAQAAPRRGLNENYARELLELHTLGVDGGYTQKDVEEVARCFTGWTIRRPRVEAEFQFDARMHDRGEKIVLGTRIPAGGGIEDGLKVIDLLVRHPSTAQFIATKLVRRFVADEPPGPLVSQAAQVFRQSDGDIRSMLRAVISAPDFFSPEAFRAKVKKPLEFVASALRHLGAETNGGPQLQRYLARMGEPLFLAHPPTGYPDVGPSWISPDTLLTRMNFVSDLTANRIPGTKVNSEAVNTVPLTAPEFQRR
ncbi:MAG: DUF1800 domain-containing protein [Candidatus Binatia bacterium]